MFTSKIDPTTVFTPRGKEVNDDMYVVRAHHEDVFVKAIRKHKNIVVHGESGTGKTWLYRKVFKDQDVYYEVLNSATINGSPSIGAALDQLIARMQPEELTGFTEKKHVEANAVFAKGGADHTNEFAYRVGDSYLTLIKMIRKKAKNRKAFLVIENLEHIVGNKDLVKQLTSLILYLDDEIYASNNVRLLLVGASNDLRDFISEADASQTIINRLQEIPELGSLPKNKVINLADKGFFDILKYNIYDGEEGFNKDYFLDKISWFSINIPQYVHDICLEIALEAENNDFIINKEVYDNSIRSWVQGALVSENTRLEKNVNSKETRHGRRNQVIYTAGIIQDYEFSNNEVEASLRENFPDSTKDKTLNVSSNLIELSSGTHPLFTKTPKGSSYRFIDPKVKIVIRWMVIKGQDEKLIIKKFNEAIKY